MLPYIQYVSFPEFPFFPSISLHDIAIFSSIFGSFLFLVEKQWLLLARQDWAWRNLCTLRLRGIWTSDILAISFGDEVESWGKVDGLFFFPCMLVGRIYGWKYVCTIQSRVLES